MSKRDWSIYAGGFGIAAYLLAVLAFVACDLSFVNRQEQTSPTQPEVVVEVDPSPAPPPEPGPPVVEVIVVEMEGAEGCNGDGEEEISPECRRKLTCTPKAADGSDVADHYAPNWSAGGLGSIEPFGYQPWNAWFDCLSAPGSAVSTCTVGGVSGARTYQCIS